MNKTAILEGAKELARLAVFAAIAAAAGWAAQRVNAFDPTSIQYIALTAVLRFVDKYIHYSEVPSKGLLPF